MSRFDPRRIPAPLVFAGLITLILVVGQMAGDIIGGYDRLAVALGAALGAEIVLSRLARGRWPMLLSAYITGNSIVILTKPTAGVLWPFWLGAFIAIASKYALTWHGQHLWNPTNFSVSALLLLAPGSVSLLSHQWGNDLIKWIILPVGLMVVWRARLLHLSLAYIAAFAVLAALRSAAFPQLWPLPAEIGPLSGPVYVLLVSFMLTDPRTTVSTRRGRIVVAVLVAVVECVIRMARVMPLEAVLAPLQTAPPIFALAIVGPIAKWLDLRRLEAAGRADDRLPRTAPAAGAPGAA